MKEYDLFSLKGKTIVATGSTGGLGTVLVKNLAWAGADVALIDIKPCEEKLENLAKEISEEYGVKAKGYVMDSSDEENIVAVRDTILNDFGKIDGLFNIAGINQHGPIEEHSEEDIKRLFSVNVAGTFACSKHFGEVMCNQGHGAILNIASIAATTILHAELTMCGYSISKAGIVQMTKAFAAEYGCHNVRVNCISPGYMDSRMSGTKGARQINVERFNNFVNENTPMGRSVKAQELVGAAIYFLSDASSCTTGVNLVVDGGFTIW